jgi:hypothetical protein
MAYNLMIEFPGDPNWQQLSIVASDCRYVEMFPIDGGRADPPAVGICLPTKGVNEEGWLELKRVLDFARTYFKGKVFDLYSGNEISAGGDDVIRRALFG